jgi:hypothetical protein
MPRYFEDGKSYYYKRDLPSERRKQAERARRRREDRKKRSARAETPVETPTPRVVRNIEVDVRLPAVVNEYGIRCELIIARARENGTIIFSTKDDGELLKLDINDLTEGLKLLREEVVVVSDDARASPQSLDYDYPVR